MIYQIPPELLEKYLEGRCTPEEIQMVHAWYESLDGKNDLVPSGDEQSMIKSRLFKRIKNHIEAKKNISSNPINFGSKSYRHMFRILTAAAAVFLLVSGFFFIYSRESKPKNIDPEIIIVSNLTSLIQKRILLDNTIVWLYPNSTIKYPKKFTGPLRVIKMDGEVFYDVKPDRKHPFVIYGGGVITRVLGTSFFMKAIKDRPTEVCVLTGQVSVSIPDLEKTEVLLLPKQQAILSKTESHLVIRNEKQVSVPGIWEKKSITFENTSMPDILKALNTEFKINVRTSDTTILAHTLNADFTDQSLPEILEMLGKSLNLTYEIDGDNFILKQPITN